METVLVQPAQFEVDLEELKKTLHIKEKTSYIQDLAALAGEAEKIAKPKALYALAFIDEKREDSVVIEGTPFKSRVLRINLEQAQRVFPYVVTCGMELEDWANQINDVLQRYWAETIKEMALRFAHQAMEAHLMERYRPGKLSRMSPGSLADWPIQEQRPLFRLLGGTTVTIGVRLTESLLMIPTKSVSGIRFPTEENFESCQLCPRESCPNRRAPYEPGLYDRKYQKSP